MRSHREREKREADGTRADAPTRTGLRPTARRWQVAKHGRQVTNIAFAIALEDKDGQTPQKRGLLFLPTHIFSGNIERKRIEAFSNGS